MRRKALAIAERLFAADPADARAKFDLAVELREMADGLVAEHDLTGAVQDFRRAIQILEEVAVADPTNKARKSQLAEGLISFSEPLDKTGHRDEARRVKARAIAMQQHLTPVAALAAQGTEPIFP